jgi:hypothetical protein
MRSELVNVSMASPEGISVEEQRARVALLLRCLAAASTDARSLTELERSVYLAIEGGATPFEVVAGTPAVLHGVRISFATGHDPRTVAARLGVADHPWGAPAWIGLRALPAGQLDVKPYHRAADARDMPRLPPGLPAGLRPVMASRVDERVELYLELAPACAWTTFVAEVSALFAPGEPPAFSPHPRPAERSFGLSLRWHGPELRAVSLFARGAALPDDQELRARWSLGMDAAELRAYELALAAVRSLGPRAPGRRWHAMVAWTWERAAGWRRAVSLRLPWATRTEEDTPHAAPR